MKANELMIGDWVQVPSLIDNEEHYDAWCRVKQLRDCDLDVVGFKELKYDEIEPIPLTLEVLEKNGFAQFSVGMFNRGFLFEYKEKDILILVSLDLPKLPNLNKKHFVSIKHLYHDVKIAIDYLHELQHVLSLCGIDKEIVL